MKEYIRKRVLPATVTFKSSSTSTSTTTTGTTSVTLSSSPFSLSSTRRSNSAKQYRSQSQPTDGFGSDDYDYNGYDRSPTANSKKFDNEVRNIMSESNDFDEFESLMGASSSPNFGRNEPTLRPNSINAAVTSVTKDEFSFSTSTSQKRRTSDSASTSEDGTMMEMAATTAFNVTAAAAAALTAPLHAALQHNNNDGSSSTIRQMTTPFIAGATNMSSSLSKEQSSLLHLEIDKPSSVAVLGSGGDNLLSRLLNKLIYTPMGYMHGQWTLLSSWIGKSPSRCWMVLLVAILIEIYATTLMKLAVDAAEEIASGTATKTTRNPTKCTMFSLFTYLVSLTMFGISLQKIDVGIAYAIWSAFGTATVAVAGMLWFGEPYSLGKVVSLALIVLGVVGLNLAEGGH